jgi:hypothetical protein
MGPSDGSSESPPKEPSNTGFGNWINLNVNQLAKDQSIDKKVMQNKNSEARTSHINI